MRKEAKIVDCVNPCLACGYAEKQIAIVRKQLQKCGYRDITLLNQYLQMRELLYYFQSLRPVLILEACVLCL